MAKLRVRYSCHLCGLHRVECEVAERGTEEVTTWLKGAALEVQRDHLQRSPDCTAKKLDELLIPIAGVNRVGEIVRS